MYATIKFFLYTFLGSVLMLVALIYLYLKGGSYAIADLQAMPLTLREQTLIFMAFLVAFAVKVPMWPVHTWLPDAHVEAPTGGSVILAAIMLKMGGYGFLRFSLPIAPDASRELDWLIIGMSLIAVVYIGLVALVQQDMKKLIAYSSIAHMGFVTLGAFAAYQIFRAHRQRARRGDGSRRRDGADDLARPRLGRALLLDRRALRPHALAPDRGLRRSRQHDAGLRLVHGAVRHGERRPAGHVRFRRRVPGDPVGASARASGTRSSRPRRWSSAPPTRSGSSSGSCSARCGNDHVAQLKDVNGREFLVLGLLAVAVLALGLWPAPLLDVMRPTIEQLVQQMMVTKL